MAKRPIHTCHKERYSNFHDEAYEKSSQHVYLFHKNWFNIDYRPKYKGKTRKFLEDNKGENIGNFQFGDGFSDTT